MGARKVRIAAAMTACLGLFIPALSGPFALAKQAPAARPAIVSGDNQNGLYTLDGWGGVHPVGSAPAVSAPFGWHGWDIARGIVTRPDHQSGYVLDGWGGIHAFGGAPDLTDSASWPGWDIARGIALTPDGGGGWVLDGWGGIHQFGDAPSLSPSGYWHGWDIARGIAADSTGQGGWVLDGWGGLHPFGDAPTLSASGYWHGWDIARGIALLPSGVGGFVLDAWGGLHQFGDAAAVSPGGYWRGWDIARGIVTWGASTSANPGGWTLDGWGGLHAFGDAPTENPTAYWYNWDIARGLGGAGDSGGSASRNVPPPKPVTFSDGTYHVGRDIPAGTYRTRVSASGCYWERLSGFSGSSNDIIANSFNDGYQVVTIAASDAGFRTSGCGTWTSDLSASGAWPNQDGVFIVGTDLAPGTYSAPGGSSCYWARLSGFGGTDNEIIANSYGGGSVIVTIQAGDVGFTSTSCGPWAAS